MDIVDALNWRYAVREFSNEVIGESELKQLLTATRLSASSYGLQPYHLMVIESAEIKHQLQKYSLGQDKIAHCSHLIVFTAQKNIGDETADRYIDKFSRVRGLSLDGLKNFSDHLKAALSAMTEQQKQEWAHQQTYIALGTFLTCAAVMKIDTCPMTGIETEGYDAVLGLANRHLTTTAVCPIGKRHPDDCEANMIKVRFDDDEMITTL